jgi:hypothetical protein
MEDSMKKALAAGIVVLSIFFFTPVFACHHNKGKNKQEQSVKKNSETACHHDKNKKDADQKKNKKGGENKG